MNASPHLPSLACSSHESGEFGGGTSASQPVQLWSCQFEFEEPEFEPEEAGAEAGAGSLLPLPVLLPLPLPPELADPATPQWPA